MARLSGDVTSVDRSVFDQFDRDKPALIARKMNSSWHRSTSRSSMVQYTGRGYPIGNKPALITRKMSILLALLCVQRRDDGSPEGKREVGGRSLRQLLACLRICCCRFCCHCCCDKLLLRQSQWIRKPRRRSGIARFSTSSTSTARPSMVRYTSKDYPVSQHCSRLKSLTRWTAYATSNVQRFKERAVAKREYKIKKLAAAMQNESEKAYCVR
jgi:hypothetical protein